MKEVLATMLFTFALLPSAAPETLHTDNNHQIIPASSTSAAEPTFKCPKVLARFRLCR